MPVKQPYTEESTNSIYELLFCDDLNTFKDTMKKPWSYPWDVLLSDRPVINDVQKIIMDTSLESRIRLLGCHILKQSFQKPSEIFLLGVIVEIGMDEGLDVLA